jgi:hypothetical protein
MAIDLEQPFASQEPKASFRYWWSVVTILLLAAIFAQAVFAGAMLSGIGWAHAAHAIGAVLLTGSTLVAALASAVTLRRIPQGRKLTLILLLLAATVFLQMAAGKMSANGANLMWLHVPLGVALVGLAAQAASVARRLGNAR